MEKADYDSLARVRMEGAQMCLKEAEHLLADELYKGADRVCVRWNLKWNVRGF